jgi:putative transposase
MDGKGRAIDNVFIERLWRSVKYEYAYLNPANGCVELYRGMDKYISFYNHERPHQTHDYKTPRELFFDQQNVA